MVEFAGNPKSTVMAIYSPTNCAPENEVKEFYNILGDAIQRKPAHNFLIVLGNFNARLGSEDALHTYHSLTNRNGSHWVDFLLEHSLIAANTQFQKRKGKLWTFKDRESNNLKQLDCILTHRKWRNSIRNVEAFNHFHTLRSDHRVVTSSIRLSLRVPKHKKTY